MKQIIILTLCLILMTSLPGFAFEKGTKSIGGSFQLLKEKSDNYNYDEHILQVTPNASYFITKNICIDASLSMALYKNKDTMSQPSYGIGIGARYFFKKTYAGMHFNYNTRKTYAIIFPDIVVGEPNIPLTVKTWISQNYLTLKAGQLVGLAKNVFLDFGVYYEIGMGQYKKSNDLLTDRDNERKKFGTSVGVEIFF